MITIGAYTTTLNPIQNGFPFLASIRNALNIFDQVSVTDCDSKDGTWAALRALQEEYGDKLILSSHEWDYDKADMMGRTKTAARRELTTDYCWQFDVDELVPAWQRAAIYSLPRNYPTTVLFDIPCITFHGSMSTTSLRENYFKWRLSKNIPWISHGVPGDRIFKEDEDGNVIFFREDSDSCEYIYKFDKSIVPTHIVWDPKLQLYKEAVDRTGDILLQGKLINLIDEYLNGQDVPCVYHYSWVDYLRKAGQEKFWNQMKKYYKEDKGEPCEVGRKIKKKVEDITDRDIYELALQYSLRKVIPVHPKRHPEEILDFAVQNKWNCIELFKEKEQK